MAGKKKPPTPSEKSADERPVRKKAGGKKAARGPSPSPPASAVRRETEATAAAQEKAQDLLTARLHAAEKQNKKSLAKLERAYAELEANHGELEIAVSEREQAEAGIRAERDFIEAVLDAAEALVLVVDREGRIVRFNKACERAAGRSLRRIRGGLVWSLIPRDQRSQVRKVFEDVMAGRYPNRLENDWVRRDGTRVRIAWSNTALVDSSGRVTHGVGVGVDVTERRKAEAALRESEAFSRSVLGSLDANVAVLDRTGVIVATNAAWDRFTQRNRGEPDKTGVGCDYLAVCRQAAPTDPTAKNALRAVEEALAGRAARSVEYACHSPAAQRWCLLSATPLRSEQGGCVVSHIDITARKGIEAALSDSEARNRALVEAAPLGIVAIDHDNRIRAINEGLERMFGYERAELLGRPLEVLLPKRYRRAHRRHQERFFRAPVNRPMGVDMALFGRAKDGREFPIEVGLGYFEAAEGPYAVAFVTDVTEKLQAQRTIEQDRDEIRELAARLMAAREEEQSRIARELHDGLVQDLAALKLDLGFLARKPETAEAGLLEEVRKAEAEAGRAAENARGISHEMHPAALERLGLVAALRANAADVRRSTGVDVLVEQDGPVPTLTQQEALALYRIAQEAIWNAARHSGSPTVTVTVRADQARVILEVADEGKGFDFVEVRTRRSLGLISMEERARVIQADLDVDARPGKGTIIRVGLNKEVPS